MTSLPPHLARACKANDPENDQPHADVTTWEQEAANTSLPEIELHTEHHPVPCEKWDVLIEGAEQLPCPATPICGDIPAAEPLTDDGIAAAREIVDEINDELLAS